MKTRVLFLAAAAVLLLATPRDAAAQPTNPGFETGDFTGWLLAGTAAATIVDAGYGSGPTEGSFQALLTTAFVEASDAALGTFLGLSPGALDAIGNGNATFGSAIRQSFATTAGDVYALDWNFLTGEGTPSSFNDFAFVVHNGVLQELADTTFPIFSSSPTPFGAETGFRSFCFTATGSETLGVGVVDVGDTVVDSGVLIDNLRVVGDGDGDGTADPCDNCPVDPNPGQADADLDGFGDPCDGCDGPGAVDGDGDAVCDVVDNCPADPNPGQQDGDFDGLGDACDPCLQDPDVFDFDGDGFCSDADICPSGCDNCPFSNNPDQADTDGEGIGDACDNCPGTANPDQEDDDFDGLGNACDVCFGSGNTDSDGDGRCDTADNCPANPNPGQEDDDFDGIGNACDSCFGPGTVDGDADGVCNANDNCPADPNPGQADGDGDGDGDACDTCFGPGTDDTDEDGLCDLADPCPGPSLDCATLFGCTGAGGSISTLYRVSPLNGVAIAVGPMGMGGCSGLAFHPSTGVLYAVGFDAFFTNSLFTVDPETGAATPVGPTGLSRTSDLAFRSDGTLFSFHRDFSSAGVLSTATGDATLLGFSGVFTPGNGITFDASDDLLHAGSSFINVIDQTTGVATPIVSLSFPAVPCSFPRINSMTTDSSGTIFGVLNCTSGGGSSNYLVTIDPTDGTVDAIGPSVPALDGITAGAGVCGDGAQAFGEECDDGNVLDGDCCTSDCQAVAAGTPCPGDASLCTVDRCDGAGACVGELPTGCKAAGKAILLLKDDDDDPQDKIIFKWLQGAAIDPYDFGDPRDSTDYALCVYTAASPVPFVDLTIPADAGKWDTISTKGYKYKDPAGGAEGVTNVILKGGTEGKTKALVKGRGANLPVAPFGFLPMPVTVQIVNGDDSSCFAAVFGAAKKNDAGRFKATTD